MENVLAMIYAEKAIILLRHEDKEITLKNVEKELNKLLNLDKKAVMSYAKVALYNILNKENEINFRTIEKEIDMLSENFTTEGIIDTAKNITYKQ